MQASERGSKTPKKQSQSTQTTQMRITTWESIIDQNQKS